ncbi:MAG: hypothetical protein IKI88_05970 [Anaerotignum sp.]|nr:hypothetical protein [Anaerotignum sp.]
MAGGEVTFQLGENYNSSKYDFSKLETGKYTVAAYVKGGSDFATDFEEGYKAIFEKTKAEFVVVQPMDYTAPEITKATAGEGYVIEYDVPEDTYGTLSLWVKGETDAGYSLKFGKKFTTSGSVTTSYKAQSGEKAFACLQLFDTIIGDDVERAVPVKNIIGDGKLNSGGKGVISNVATVTFADPEDAPLIDKIGGNIAASDGKFYVNRNMPIVVEVSDNGGVLPPKTVKVTNEDGASKKFPVDASNKAVIDDVTFAADGEYDVTVTYDGFIEAFTSVKMVVKNTADVKTDEDTFYMDIDGAAVTGTSGDIDGEITVTFADGGEETTEVGADGKWKVPLDYVSGRAGKATVKVLNVYTGKTAECEFMVEVGEIDDIQITPKEEYGKDKDGVVYTNNKNEFVFDVTHAEGKEIKVELTDAYGNIEEVPGVTSGPTVEIPCSIYGSAGFEEGTYVATVTYADSAYTQKATLTIVLDMTAPASIGGLDTIVNTSESATLELNAGDEGATVKLTIGEEDTDTFDTFTGVDDDFDGKVTFAFGKTYPAGTKVSVTVTDLAGNSTTFTVNDEGEDYEVLPGEVKEITITPVDAAQYDDTNIFYTNVKGKFTFEVDYETSRQIKVLVDGKEVKDDGLQIAVDEEGKTVITVPASAFDKASFDAGEHTVKVEYVESAYEELAAEVIIVVDLTAPENIAGLDEIYDVAGKVTLTLDEGDYGATVTLTIGDKTYEAVKDDDFDGVVEFDIEKHPVGTEITAVVTDLAGNSKEFTGNKVKPSKVAPIEITTPESYGVNTLTGKAYTKVNTELTFTATYEEDAKVNVWVGDKKVKDAVADKDFTIKANEYGIAGGIYQGGEYTIKVEYADPAYQDEELELTATKVIVVDTKAPTEIGGLDQIFDNTTKVTLTLAEGDEGATVVLKIGDKTYEAVKDDNFDGEVEFEIDKYFVDTPIEVTITDLAGNESAPITAKVLKREDVAQIKATPEEQFIYRKNASEFKYTVTEADDTILPLKATVTTPEGNEVHFEGVDKTEQTVKVSDLFGSMATLENGVYTVKISYADPAYADLSAEITVEVVEELPGTPELVEPTEVTNRTKEITVKMGGYAATAKVYVNDVELTGVTVEPVVSDDEAKANQWIITLPEFDKDSYITYGSEIKVAEVDKAGKESEVPLSIDVKYDPAIAVEITKTSADDDMVIDAVLDEKDIVIEGTTTEVYSGMQVEVLFEMGELALPAQAVAVGTDGTWKATWEYNKTLFKGLDDGAYTVTARLLDERPEIEEGKYTQDTTTITIDTVTPDAPVITGSVVDGNNVDGKVTTKSTAIYGTAEAGMELTLTTPKGTYTVTVADDGTWTVDISADGYLSAGDEVYAVVTDEAGHVSDPSNTVKVETASVQEYDIAIDDLDNPFINTIVNNAIKFTGTTTAQKTDEIDVAIQVDFMDYFVKRATVNDDKKWTVTFGGEGASNSEIELIKALSDSGKTPPVIEGTKVAVVARFVEEGETVTDNKLDSNTTYIYPDSTAPKAPAIDNEFVSNRTTVLKVTSNEMPYKWAAEGDKGAIKVYVDGTDIAVPETDMTLEDNVWTIKIPQQKAGTEIYVTETDMAGNESEASNKFTVKEAEESDPGDPAIGTVDELKITYVGGLTKYVVNGVDTYYVNRDRINTLSVKGEAANENVKVSFVFFDKGKNVNADSVITGVKEWTVSGNAWSVDLNIGALSKEEPENNYQFKIVYTNLENSGKEGVIGEAIVNLVIDNQAPEAVTVNPIYDRDETITGEGLLAYTDGEPINYELQYSFDGGDTWTTVAPEEVTNDGGAWSVKKATLGLESGIRKELGKEVTFRQVDRADNASESVSETIKITTMENENAAPIVITYPKNGATVANGTKQLTITGTGQPGEKIWVRIGEGAQYNSQLLSPSEMYVDADGKWSVTFGDGVNTEFTVGQHVITATYEDITTDGENLYTVTSTFNVPKPSSNGGSSSGGGSSYKPKTKAIVVNEKAVKEGTTTLTGTAQSNKEILVYGKDASSMTNNKGTLIGKAKVDAKGDWKLDAGDKLADLEPGKYVLTAVYDLGNNATDGNYKSELLVKGADDVDVNVDAFVTFTIGSRGYTVDGSEYYTDVAPYIDMNGRTMLPLRAFAHALSIDNSDITWDDATKTATVRRPDGKTIVVQIGVNVVIVNGVRTVIDTTPVIKDGRTFLPFRAMFNAFGISDDCIVWDNTNKRVIVTKDAVDELKAMKEEAAANAEKAEKAEEA